MLIFCPIVFFDSRRECLRFCLRAVESCNAFRLLDPLRPKQPGGRRDKPIDILNWESDHAPDILKNSQDFTGVYSCPFALNLPPLLFRIPRLFPAT